MTRFAIVGAGATGGFLGAHLVASGADVTLIARGAHLAAMRERGLTLRRAGEKDLVTTPDCTDDLGAVAAADVVLLAVKAHALPSIAPQVGSELQPTATLITLQNGIPWWYFERHGGSLDGTRLETVDPGGAIAGSFDSAQVVGAVVYPATRLAEPGVVEHVEGDRLTLGELDGSRSERCQAIAAALIRSGLRCPVRRDIRKELWLKLLGNVAFNPLSALTRATMASIAADLGVRAVALAMMREAEQVAAAVGVTMDLTAEQRLEGAGRVGEHRTSMLQDVEAGRPLEVDALVGAVVEIGRLTGVPVPHLEMAWACVRLLDSTRAAGRHSAG